ncbi:MAG: hypothetical protein U5Q03_03550 [Bacteroidota bacterium]|nr:hypothetical protein [Bacteroidota bacterium]
MIRQFTFSENNLESFIRHAHHWVPGIDKMIAVYYDEKTDSMQGRLVSGTAAERKTEVLNVLDSRDVTGRMRIDQSRFNWYNRDDLPFDLEKKSRREASIFSELDNIVLLLRFRNTSDKLNDLLFIYFNRNFGSFGLSNATKRLSTDNKQIIATLLYNSFNTQIYQNKQDREVLQNIRSHTNALMGEVEKLKRDLQRTRSDYGESLVNLCMEYIRTFSTENNRNYLLGEEAKNKIKTFKGNIKYLSAIIRESIIFAENIHAGDDFDEILIKDYHINLDNYDTESVDEKQSGETGDKYTRTTHLLDKLENAARTVIGRRQSLTSGNVGEACPTPITAPAITDALKKHRNKILHLFNAYPEKWEIIRREFRPVRNLIVSAEQEKFKSA